MTATGIAHQIANAHTLFNVFNTIIFLPFVKPFAALIRRLLPDKAHKVVEGAQYLDPKLIEATPGIAVEAVKNECAYMGFLVIHLLDSVQEVFFNDKKDLERYPRTLDADCALLEACGADYVFAPSVEEMYPVEDKRQFDFPPVTTVMEGAHRPGHFNGVCQVVSRLFYIVRPDRAYFGEKDWQQIAVVKAMVRFLNLNVQIVECTTIREEDGLAKSSRNTLLSADERAIAPRIYEALKASREYAKTRTLAETHDYVVSTINAVDGLEVEYFSIVDGDTLLDVANWDDSAYVVGCITVYCGKTPIRLIDHITYKK